MPKKVCIVGYGNIGPVHAKILEQVNGAVLHAVCDIDVKRLHACREHYDVITYEDFDEMLRDNEINSVHICTPHYLHFDMIKKALNTGKAVVVEKPVTITKEQFEELKVLERAENVCVVLQNRLNPSIQKMKELVRSEKLGKIRGAKGIVTWCRESSYYEGADWRGKWATEGGGVLINQAIHTLDYFCYLLGKVEIVKANMFNYSLENVIEVEDTFVADLSIENGIKGLFFATNAYKENSAPYFEILFEKGIARYMDGQLWVNQQLMVQDSVLHTGKSYWGSSHAELLKQYYEEQRYFSVFDVENTMNTVFAMYESAGNGGCEIKTGSNLNRR